jgi:hypothetical protein
VLQKLNCPQCGKELNLIVSPCPFCGYCESKTEGYIKIDAAQLPLGTRYIIFYRKTN